MSVRKMLLLPTLGAMVMVGGAMAQDSSAQSSGSQGSSAAQSSSASSQSGSSKVSATDKAFMKKAAQGGLEEVEIGNMVAEKASSDDVKQFAQRMVQDHTKANDELKSLAEQKGVTLPTTMNAEGKAMKVKLEKLSGAQLDKAYMRGMVKDHTKDVQEFKTASNTAKDSDLKAWAGKTLPTLQDHLKQAKDVAQKTGASSGTSQTAQQ